MPSTDTLTVTIRIKRPWLYFALACFWCRLERLGNWALMQGVEVCDPRSGKFRVIRPRRASS